MERERERERWSDKYVCRESGKNSTTSTLFNLVFATQCNILTKVRKSRCISITFERGVKRESN